jgi:hypothetical protein
VQKPSGWLLQHGRAWRGGIPQGSLLLSDMLQ